MKIFGKVIGILFMLIGAFVFVGNVLAAIQLRREYLPWMKNGVDNLVVKWPD